MKIFKIYFLLLKYFCCGCGGITGQTSFFPHILPTSLTRSRHTWLSPLQNEPASPCLLAVFAVSCVDQGWEFIKEKKEVNKKVNTHASTQKRTRSRKHAFVHANTHSYKKASTQKRTRARKHAHKQANMHSSKKASTKKELVQEKSKMIKKIRSRSRKILNEEKYQSILLSTNCYT